MLVSYWNIYRGNDMMSGICFKIIHDGGESGSGQRWSKTAMHWEVVSAQGFCIFLYDWNGLHINASWNFQNLLSTSIYFYLFIYLFFCSASPKSVLSWEPSQAVHCLIKASWLLESTKTPTPLSTYMSVSLHECVFALQLPGLNTY